MFTVSVTPDVAALTAYAQKVVTEVVESRAEKAIENYTRAAVQGLIDAVMPQIEDAIDTAVAKAADGHNAVLSDLIAPAVMKELAERVSLAAADHTPIEYLRLSRRSMNCLLSKDITTVGALTRMTRRELLDIPELGPGSADEISRVLKDRGFSLATKRGE